MTTTTTDTATVSPAYAAAFAKLTAWQGYLRKLVIGRDREIDSMLAALISGDHVALLGPPGEAKSYMARAFAEMFLDADDTGYFEYLFTRFTKAEELFGPIDLAALKEGKYMHVTDGSLITAKVAFLDEAFKANSGILNSMLGILNERKFNNGNQRRMDVPLRMAVLASNEFPTDECNALWDRCLIRCMIDRLDPDQVMKVLTTKPPKRPERLTEEELDLLADHARDIPCDHEPELKILMQELVKADIEVSTRRWVWINAYLKAAAVVNGAGTVTANEFKLIIPALWNDDKQIGTVEGIVSKIKPSDRYKAKLKEIVTEVTALADKFQNGEPTERYKLVPEILESAKQLSARGASLRGLTKEKGFNDTLEDILKALTDIQEKAKDAIKNPPAIKK